LCLAELPSRQPEGDLRPRPKARGWDENARRRPRSPPSRGLHDAAAIILLSDGRATGIDTLRREDGRRPGVRIYVVGLAPRPCRRDEPGHHLKLDGAAVRA
jgi:hypothetical protein